eukprot:CAMPEP_0180448258 /NCGR_PEP_ID=MMETSP1036_2-20121128/17127_1 /TAXON_ID=632150 /ORGANISM="Azadinium spinosum, Strain 3D9" /LENGTH=155 /DNA_ID=CAMNT_0022454655 /DNA_START=50 /DNA_END=517 /DNA_ORIENTATION=-
MGCFDLPLYLTVQHSRAGANLWFTAYGLYALVTGQVQKHMLPLTLLALMGSVLLIIIGADIMDKVIGAELRKRIKDKVDSSNMSYYFQGVLNHVIIALAELGKEGVLGPRTTFRLSISLAMGVPEWMNGTFMPWLLAYRRWTTGSWQPDITKKTD